MVLINLRVKWYQKSFAPQTFFNYEWKKKKITLLTQVTRKIVFFLTFKRNYSDFFLSADFYNIEHFIFIRDDMLCHFRVKFSRYITFIAIHSLLIWGSLSVFANTVIKHVVTFITLHLFNTLWRELLNPVVCKF